MTKFPFLPLKRTDRIVTIVYSNSKNIAITFQDSAGKFLCSTHHIIRYATIRSIDYLEQVLRKSPEGFWRQCMCLSDQDLLELLAEDLDRHFGLLIAAYQQKLFAFIFFKVRHWQDAEDIFQETWLHAYRWLASLPSHKLLQVKLRPWLFKIAYRCLINDRTRGRKCSSQLVSMDYLEAQELLESLCCEHAVSPEQEVEEKEAYYTLHGCIQQLPDAFRFPVILHYIIGLSYREVADILHQPFNTVKSNGRRGIEKLQRMMDQSDWTREEVD